MELDRIRDFIKFLDKELAPAVDELEKLSDVNRKHVQKLVYTNMVDRFDHLVDGILLDNCRDEHLLSKAYAANDQPITESELVSLLLRSDDLQTALNGGCKISLDCRYCDSATPENFRHCLRCMAT